MKCWKIFLYQGNLYTIEIVHELEDVTLHLNDFWLDGQVLKLIFLFHFYFNILSFSIYFPSQCPCLLQKDTIQCCLQKQNRGKFWFWIYFSTFIAVYQLMYQKNPFLPKAGKRGLSLVVTGRILTTSRKTQGKFWFQIYVI